MQPWKFRIFPCGHPRNHVIAFTTLEQRKNHKKGCGKVEGLVQEWNGFCRAWLRLGWRSLGAHGGKIESLKRIAYGVGWSWEKNLKFDPFELSARSWVLDSLCCCATIVVIIWPCFGQQLYWAETSVSFLDN